MELVVDLENLGTPESEWRRSWRLSALASLGPISAKRIVVVAPHPDDELFGAGGLVQRAIMRAST